MSANVKPAVMTSPIPGSGVGWLPLLGVATVPFLPPLEVPVLPLDLELSFADICASSVHCV